VKPLTSTSRRVLAALAVGSLVSFAHAQVKVPRPVPAMPDVKTPAPAEPLLRAHPERVVPQMPRAPLPPKVDTKEAPATLPIDFSKVWFDSSADGATWARGRTYKARFDAGGATYIPFLGSSAPHNYPVRVELASARVGTTELALQSNGVARAGDDVTIERGPLREVWHLTPDAAEQSFVLAARPAAAGALSLSLSLDSELQAREVAGGIELVNERGGVSIGQTVVVDADGTRTQLAARLEGGRMALDVPAEVLASARYPLVVDPLYATNALEMTSTHTALADITNAGVAGHWTAVYQYDASASDADTYLIEVYFGIPDFNSGSWVDISTDSWLAPRVAYNALSNTTLTVAQVRPNGNNPSEIWARARTNGTVNLFQKYQVQNSAGGSCIYADVGGDPALTGPTYFMVVWTREYSANDWDIHSRLLYADGSIAGATTYIENSGAFDYFPRISKTDGRPPFATQEWNLTWMRSNGANTDVFGAQIHWDGTVTTPAFAIDTSSYNDTFPSASSLLDGNSGPRPWCVTYSRHYSTDDDVMAVPIVGSSVGTLINLSVDENAQPYENQLDPAVDTNGQRFVVAYAESYNGSSTDHDLYMATMHLTNGALTVDEAHVNVDFDSLDTRGPSLSGCITEADHGFPYYGMTWPRSNPTTENVFVGSYYEPQTVDTFCYGDGSSGSCPCGNFGGSGRGCANSVTNGGQLYPQGENSVISDSFSLSALNLPPTAPVLFFQGTVAGTSAAFFGDGLRCVNGSLVRIATKTAVNGNATYPGPGDLPISVKGGIPAEGGARAYQAWYRNGASFCTASTFNLTGGVRMLWLR
jgi:hypothetical protein